MKDRHDLVRSWVRKAESDLTAMELVLAAGQALDTACFHAQQAGEKYLKAYLVHIGMDFPYIHNLEKLIDLCSQRDAAFLEIKPLAALLTPFAVELRYDNDFWPSLETVKEARDAALEIKQLVAQRLPQELLDSTGRPD
jgi:HEPN domain-containing protein